MCGQYVISRSHTHWFRVLAVITDQECNMTVRDKINFIHSCSLITEEDILFTVTYISEMNVVIGFLGSPYSVNESAGELNVQVGVISGSLQTNIVLNLSTTDITAIGILFILKIMALLMHACFADVARSYSTLSRLIKEACTQ